MGSPEQSSEPVNSTAECTGPEGESPMGSNPASGEGEGDGSSADITVQWPPRIELKPSNGRQPMCGASGYGVEKGGPFDEPEQSEVSNVVTVSVVAPDS